MGPKTQMNYVLTAYSSCDKDSKFTLLHFMKDNYQSRLSARIVFSILNFYPQMKGVLSTHWGIAAA